MEKNLKLKKCFKVFVIILLAIIFYEPLFFMNHLKVIYLKETEKIKNKKQKIITVIEAQLIRDN